MPLALSTGHEVGLAVTGAAFIAFAVVSAFLFPRFRPQYPGGGLPAFIVVAFVFFFGMLTAVEVFGAETKKGGEERVAETGAEQPTTAQRTTTQATLPAATSTRAATTTPKTTTRAVLVSPVRRIQVSEAEFKIAGPSSELVRGKYQFDVVNDGKIPHDLAIKGGPKTKLVQPGASAQLTVTLAPGKYHLYCSVPGHEQAGMKLDITVS